MSISDICDHADIRACNLCKWFHITEMTDPHFKNSNFMLLAEIEYGQRKSDLVVEIPFGL